MEEILKEVVSTYLIPAVITVLGAFITWAGAKIKKAFEEKVKDEQVRKIVLDVVKYIERTAKDLTNSEKFSQALEKSAEWLSSKGIEVNITELALLIEASVNELPKTQKEGK